MKLAFKRILNIKNTVNILMDTFRTFGNSNGMDLRLAEDYGSASIKAGSGFMALMSIL
jgi:hypothetical protein